MGRNTQGVKLVNLRENDSLVAIQKVEGADENDEEKQSLENATDSQINGKETLIEEE